MFKPYFYLIFTVAIVAAEKQWFKKCLERGTTIAIVRRHDSGYGELDKQLVITPSIRPLGFLIVNSEKDVSKSVACLRKFQQKFSIRCGGHSFAKYSFGDNESWVIDVSKLNSIVVNKESSTVTVGAGANTLSINEAIYRSGFGIPAGTCGSVGVSGFAMGGGYGLQTRKHGFLVDRIVEAKIVTYKGSVIVANTNKHRDLFWALRGAGAGNFGVVTQFTLKMFNASNIFIWIKKKYNMNEFADFLKQWQQVITLGNRSSIDFFVIRNAFEDFFEMRAVINNVMLSESEEQLQFLKKYFSKITEQNVKRGNYLEMLKDTNNEWQDCKFYLRSKSWFISRFLSQEEIEIFANFIRKRTYAGFSFGMCPTSGQQPKRTDTAFVHRDCLFVFKIRYILNVCNDEELDNASKLDTEYYNGLKQLYQSLSFINNGESYQNYADNGLENWEQRYYGENYERLKSVKRKYDPKNIFRFNQSIALY